MEIKINFVDLLDNLSKTKMEKSVNTIIYKSKITV